MNNLEYENLLPVFTLCDDIAREKTAGIESKKAESCRKLTSLVRKAMKHTEKIYKKAVIYSEKSSEMSDAFLWLTDNISFIEEEFAFCINSLPRHKSIASCKIPLIFSICSKLCELCDGEISDLQIKALVQSCDLRFKSGLTVDDTFSFPLLIKASVLCFIGDLSRSFLNSEQVFDKSGKGKHLIYAIKSLKYLSNTTFDELFSECRLEKILMRDPSGAYPSMTESSKKDLLTKLSKNAKKAGLHDCEYAELLLKTAQNAETEQEKYIGFPLMALPFFRKLYFPFIYLLTLAITFILCLLTSFKLAPIIFFPVFEVAKTVIDTLTARLYRKPFVLPAIRLDHIPDDAKTLCVITALLRGEKYDAELFSRLEKIRNANSGKNIKFGILCDLCDSDTATAANDEQTIRYACGRIDSLNSKYGNEFIFFIRGRSYSKTERKFIAYERKRGAVIELVKLIKERASSFDTGILSLSQNLDFIYDVKYVITLDSDTNLGLSGATELVEKMLHPFCRPIIDKKQKKVVSGYGLLQPKMSPDIDAAKATPFTRLICGTGGTDIYSSASFDLYQCLFGEGIFCGKGIFDTGAFYETIVKSDFFPEDTILSHDILEGERLRTALLCDVELTDGFPKNELSYLKRKHRWIRGDIQNLKFIKKSFWVNEKQRKNDLKALSKYKLYDNARRIFTPIFSLVLILISFFAKSSFAPILVCTALVPFAAPFIIDAFTMLSSLSLKSAARKFFSKGVTSGIWQSFLRMLYFICMLAKDTVLSLCAVVISSYRMLFSKKHLLEWVTAAQSDSGKNSLPLYISKHFISCVIGAFLFIFSPGGILRILGLAFFVMPLLGYFTSKDFSKTEKTLSEKNKKIMKTYARDIWNFFEENVTVADNYLPPDNIQLIPYKKTAHRTSPTNIGLYMSSLLAARDFGFIDTNTLHERLDKTLSTVEKLPKWHGNLYNWYDTEKLSLLKPEYVSSVDSGNFVACLICLEKGLAEYSDENTAIVDLINRISVIISSTDLSPLYNEKRKLFRVGVQICDKEEIFDEGCYDFLMSEARILSYVAAASRLVGVEHWKKLSRPLISEKGYIGLASWSGTAFEYFMPNLFMPAKKGSLLYEATLFAFREQKLRRVQGIYGISESGFFAFDSELNYQYKAFGVPSLGQKSDLESDLVISPYSSFLFLNVSIAQSLKNLSQLTNFKAYGKYGFYEAVDLTPTRVKNGYACVKSYMSHHLGMSLLSLSNACHENNFVRRFMSNGKMAAGTELLEEKIPVNAIIKKPKKASLPHKQPEKQRPIQNVSVSGFLLTEPVTACLSDGNLSCTVSNCGHVRLARKDILIANHSSEIYPSENFSSVFCHFLLDGRLYGISPLAHKPYSDSCFSFSYNECEIAQNMSCDRGEFELKYTIDPKNFSLLRIRLSGKTTAKNASFRFSFAPCLSNEKAYLAHPAFSELFIEAIYDEDEKILFFKRRKRTTFDDEYVLAAAFSDRSRDFDFLTKKPFDNDDKYAYFSDCNEKKGGACINPFCVMGHSFKDKCENELLLVMTHSVNDAKSAVLSARRSFFGAAVDALSDTASQFALGAGISSVSNNACIGRILSGIMFGSDANGQKRQKLLTEAVFGENRKCYGIDSLWKHKISGDHPIVTADVGGYFSLSATEKLIRTFKLLNMKNIRYDFVLIFNENNKYERKNEKKLRSLILTCNAEGYLERAGNGIHLLEKQSLGEDIYAIIQKSCVFLNLSTAHTKGQNAEFQNKIYPVTVTKGKPIYEKLSGFKVAGGEFLGDSFVIDKHADTRPQTPFAHILSGENISSVVTQNSLGYTFCKNASEKRITPIQTSGNSECSGEKLYLSENGVVFDLCACSSQVIYSCGKAEYIGFAAGCKYKITVFCSSKLPVKTIKFEYSGVLSQNAKLFFASTPCMGRTSSSKNIVYHNGKNCIFFKDPLSDTFGDSVGFLVVFSESEAFFKPNILAVFGGDDSFAQSGFVCIGCGIPKKKSCFFVLGAAKEKSKVYEKVCTAFKNGCTDEEKSAEAFCASLIPDIRFCNSNISDKQQSIEKMFNMFLSYSAVFSRTLARSGYYQSGGAYGFRDQLQDCLCVLYSDKKRALNHIYRAACHQFFEGDALHWWHKQGHKGVRTRCSDDYLWLPYAVTQYLSLSGDHKFLNTILPYISAEPLMQGENERYMSYKKSSVTESLYLHCIRALDRALSLTGKHGLCLMGTCDWCDGYSLVGKGMIGESVFTSMFLVYLLEKFIPVCKKMGDEDNAKKYAEEKEKMKHNILSSCFDNGSGYFIRGFYDDGEKLGSAECDEGKIDLLPQAFAHFAEMPEEKCISAMLCAKNLLFDDGAKIMKLLSPAFDKTKKEPGYIKGYIPGVRENGGQYTHGAMFYVLGCFEMAEKLYEKDREISKKLTDIGGQILLYSNPAYRTSRSADKHIRDAYKTEPYAVCADIYSNSDQKGRGGWTHYTGASGWMYRLMLKYLFGIEFCDIDSDAPYISINTKRHFPMEDVLSEGRLEIFEFGFSLKIDYIFDAQKKVTDKSGNEINGTKIEKTVNHVTVHI